MSGAIAVGPGPAGAALAGLPVSGRPVQGRPVQGLPVPGRIMEPAFPLTGGPSVQTPGPKAEAVSIPVTGGTDPVMSALRSGGIEVGALDIVASATPKRGSALPAAGALHAAGELPTREDAAPATPDTLAANRLAAPTAVGLLDRPESTSPTIDATATERCTEERRLANERCELATVARARADRAADTLRAAQRAYDAHQAAATGATTRADPLAIRDAKDGAQDGFRAAVTAATSPDELEAAARNWLNEINRINTEAREATVSIAREHAAALEAAGTLERLSLEADAARIVAENADAACLAARVALAECDEGSTTPVTTIVAPSAVAVGSGAPHLDDDETLELALEAGGEPRIFRLLRGDRQAMTSLVASLAGDDPDAQRRWQLQLTDLVEAIVADAIEASALEFPDDHEFWGGFGRAQGREIAQALSALGYRFDGLGGWTDGRQPSQRDLSLALGYAGQDPKRIRHWPTEAAIGALFNDVTVAADEYLAGIAGDLTLPEMVSMLGRRADALAELWNQWGRVRPLLLDEG